MPSGAVLAQSQPAVTSSGGLEEIVVTATRRSENIQNVPISMDAISGATLDKLGDKNFLDYAGTIPNLSVGNGSGAGGAGNGFGVSTSRSVTIRGVAGNNTTGFYLNDTPIPPSADPRVLDVERVEVLRGPQGTLFGSSSMGGTVRMITREPAPDVTTGKVEAEGYDVNHGSGGYSVNGTLNVPLIAGNVGLRVSAFSAFEPGVFTRQWGSVSPLSPSVPLPPGASTGEKTGVGATQETGMSLSLGITPSVLPGLTVTPMFMYQHSNSNGYPLADYTPNNFVQIRPLNVPESVEDTWSFGALTLKYEAGFGRFIGLGSYFYRNGFDDEDGTDVFATDFFPALGLPTARYYVPAPLYNNLYTKTWSGETRFESNLPGPVQFILGAFSSTSERHFAEIWPVAGSNALSGGVLGSDIFYTQNSPNTDRERATFLDVTYHVTSALQVSAGVRHAYLAHEGSYIADGPLNGGPSNVYAEHGENDTAPRFTAEYHFLPDQLVYASAAKGFRIGGTNSLVPPLCNAGLAALGLTNGQPFNSDSLWSYEVGSKNSWLGNLVKSRLAVYRIDWKGIQQVTNLPCNFQVTTNSGAAVSNGAEFEIDAAPVEHLTLNLAAGIEDAKITEVSPGSLTVLGQPLQEVPKWTGSAITQYSVPLDGRSLFIGAQYTYSDSRTSFTNIPASMGGRALSPYSLVNLRVGVNQGPWEVALFARNVFDVRAELSDLNSETAELPGRPRWFVARPRTIGLQLRREF